jgi:PKD repeat protein
MIILSALGWLFNNVSSQVNPLVAVDPSENAADPSESFTLNVTVANVNDLYSYEVKVGFEVGLIDVILNATEVQEGPFLKEGAPEGTYFVAKIYRTYVHVAGLILGDYPGVSGSGTLFTINFTVISPGKLTLGLYDTSLRDSNLDEITHNTQDGLFYTRVPVAYFTYSPHTYGRPIVGENVTFDASLSYDPDGGEIVHYFWDFGDGTNATSKIVTHSYNESSTPAAPHNVTLTVIDDDNRTYTYFPTIPEEYVHVKYHDIAITEIVTPEEVSLGGKAAIEVTVLNNGSHHDTFNLTLYYDSNPINTTTIADLAPGTNETVSFIWNTFINQTTKEPGIVGTGTWNDSSKALDSDDVYTFSDVDQSYQDFRGYIIDTTGWTGISKVEVGLEVKTDPGGDDQISVRIHDGTTWVGEYIYNVTWTTDKFFWIDVTGNLKWDPEDFKQGKMKVRIKYIQVGDNATPIYVDWLPVRITPSEPSVVPEGTYLIWANIYLVTPADEVPPLEFRPNEEPDTADNIFFNYTGIIVTEIPVHDIAVSEVKVDRTDIPFGSTATITVKIVNEGNREETFIIFVYANSTEVANETITLLAGDDTTVTFDWEKATDTFLEGTYIIEVNVTQVINEADIADNQMNITVEMKLLPVATYTFSPSSPIVGDTITFNASLSYAPGIPGGEIIEYLWDFGDNNNATGKVVAHSYNKPGSYTVTLTVKDNENLTTTATQRVTIRKIPSTVVITASPTTVINGTQTTLSGYISPIRKDVSVTINYTTADGTWVNLTTVRTNQDGNFTYEWIPPDPGTYLLRAFWPGDEVTASAVSVEIQVKVIIRDGAVTGVSLPKIKVKIGEIIMINVTVLNNGTEIETFNITLLYNDTIIETKTVTDVTSGAKKTISFNWNTKDIEEGIYIIKAVTESLNGERNVNNNELTAQIMIVGPPPLNIFLYTTIGMAISTIALLVYLIRLKKS